MPNKFDSGVIVDLPAGNYTIAINSHDKIGRELLDSNENWEDAVGIMPKPLPKTTDAGLLLNLPATAYIATVSDSDGNEGGKAVFSIMVRE